MKTSIEFHLKEGVYVMSTEWPEIGISCPMQSTHKLGAYRMEEMERLHGADRIKYDKEMTAILFRDALWELQAYMFKTIQKETL